MTKWTQQMPILMEVNDITALTTEEADEIKKYIEQETILDVQFKDASGEIMIPVGFVPETVSDGEVTAPAVVTVIKNGSVVKASAAAIVYDFTSYASDKTTELATGKVSPTGEKQTIGDDDFIEIVVIENTFEWAIGHKYLVSAEVEADGTTKYPIYETDGTDTHMWVVISEEQ